MTAEVRIEAADLRRSFAGRVAVGGLTLRMLAGLLDPDAGSVRLLGADPFSSDGSVREGLGYMPQQYSLYGDLSVDENMAFFAELFCLDRPVFRERRARLLKMTRLEEFGARRADALSGGMYKKLALACALLHQPKALLLDEPTNGVDPVSRREFWDLLHDFLGEGMAIIIATPYMDEAARCDRVGLLFEGRMLEEGRPGDLLRGFQHPVFQLAGDRPRISALIDQRDDILAFTPAGTHLRIVVRKGSEQAVLAALAGLGAEAVPTLPTFEDLFLARMKEGRRHD